MSKHRILICPGCNEQGSMVPCNRQDSLPQLCCGTCGWKGTYKAVQTFEYERERVNHFKLDYLVISYITRKFYGTFDLGPIFARRCAAHNCYKFEVTGELDKCGSEQVKHFCGTGEPIQLSNNDVLNILCRDGWLDPGIYVIKVHPEVLTS